MTTEGDNAERSVTLIIPSVYHRARFVDRVLYYLSHSGLQCPVVVTDHSPHEHASVISDIVKRQRGLDVTLLAHPADMHFLKRRSDCAAVPQTPFVHLHADDDFVVRPTLKLLIAEMQRRRGVKYIIRNYFLKENGGNSTPAISPLIKTRSTPTPPCRLQSASRTDAWREPWGETACGRRGIAKVHKGTSLAFVR